MILNGKQALFVDIANNYGLDKDEFDKRLAFVEENIDKLEELILDADEPVAYMKSVMALRTAQQGKPTGHMVEFDSTTSGVQIMSALTGCYNGALWTNLINPLKRYDCYTEAFQAIVKGLKSRCEVTRAQAKNALMTFFYGSSAEPKKELGDGTDLEDMFYTVCERKLPGAYELRNELIDIWDPEATEYSCTMPDGFVVMLRVVNDLIEEITIDELGYVYHHEYKEVGTKDFAVSLAANIIHAIDAYIVREMHRRCNYLGAQREYNFKLKDQAEQLEIALLLDTDPVEEDLSMPLSLRRAMADVETMDKNEMRRANKLLNQVMTNRSFELVTIHDAFKCQANHVQTMREHYKEILAELAESDILSHIFRELTGNEDEVYTNVRGGLTKTEMAKYIRNSEYAIC